jgi:glycerol-3-phosphate cytidylyltransferase-like family protein
VHDGHKHYLFQAKKYGNYLTTIVASDENIKKIKSVESRHKLTQRVESVKGF